MKTQLTARFVIGYAGGDHVIYPGGEVVYDGDTIVFVGHGYPGPVDIAQDYGDAIVSPGFIDLDALADIDHAILDTWLPTDRQLGQQWSEEYFRKERRAGQKPAQPQLPHGSRRRVKNERRAGQKPAPTELPHGSGRRSRNERRAGQKPAPQTVTLR